MAMIKVRLATTAAGFMAATALALYGCGGGSSGAGETIGESVYDAGAVSLVDGRVGDSPFHDADGEGGLADGRAFQYAGGTPVTIEWTPPSGRVDGASEARLAGYRIYYGHKPGNYEYVIELAEPAAQSYRLAGLPAGTYYFAVSAVDGENQEGALSSVAAVTVD